MFLIAACMIVSCNDENVTESNSSNEKKDQLTSATNRTSDKVRAQATDRLNERNLNIGLEMGSAGNSCLEEQFTPNPANCEKGTYIGVLNIPMYPGCSFFVSVDYVLCTQISGIQIYHFGDFKIKNHNCPQFNQDLLNSTPAWELQFNTQIWASLNSNLLNDLVPGTYAQIAFQYIIAACSRTCYEESEPDPRGFIALIPIKVQCSPECCRRYTLWQRGSDGNWINQSTTYSNFTNGCPIANDPPCSLCTGGCGVLLGF